MGACGSSPKAVKDFSVQTRIITPRPSPPILRTQAPIIYQSLASTPFTKPAFHRENQLDLLHGYEHETSTKLDESLLIFRNQIDGLSNQIAEAMKKCHFPSEHGLTHDESAAVYLYTMRRDPNNVFFHLIRALESNNRSICELWFKYLYLLRTAVMKLPKTQIELYQGIPSDEHLPIKSAKFYSSLGSASPSIDVVKRSFERENLDDNNNETNDDLQMVQIILEKVNAYKIFEYSENDYEEYLIWPGQKLTTMKNDSPHGIMTMHLVGETEIQFENSTIKHFVCPLGICGKVCDRKHDPNHHCHFCLYLPHARHPHCKLPYQCSQCGIDTTTLYQCKGCGRKFCEQCCMKIKQKTLTEFRWRTT